MNKSKWLVGTAHFSVTAIKGKRNYIAILPTSARAFAATYSQNMKPNKALQLNKVRWAEGKEVNHNLKNIEQESSKPVREIRQLIFLAVLTLKWQLTRNIP